MNFLKLVLCLATICLIVSCNECPVPQKDSKVPKEAVWGGGCDGGFWYKLIEQNKEKIRVKIFTINGELYLDTYFSNLKSNCIIDSKPLKNNDMIFMNDTLSIKKNNCKLIPIYPANGGLYWQHLKDINKKTGAM